VGGGDHPTVAEQPRKRHEGGGKADLEEFPYTLWAGPRNGDRGTAPRGGSMVFEMQKKRKQERTRARRERLFEEWTNDERGADQGGIGLEGATGFTRQLGYDRAWKRSDDECTDS